MILLLGATGYIGSAFATELHRRRTPFTTLSRAQLDYTRFDLLLPHLRRQRPTFVINAAGFTGKPNVDACETARADTLLGNTLLPQTIAHACAAAEIPWAHVSSGCIYAGAKISLPTNSPNQSAPPSTASPHPLPAKDERGEISPNIGSRFEPTNLDAPPLPAFGHPLLHSEWRRGMGRGGAPVHGEEAAGAGRERARLTGEW